MYIWTMKKPNILAYIRNIIVTLHVEEISEELSAKEKAVTPRVAIFQIRIWFVAITVLAKLL